MGLEKINEMRDFRGMSIDDLCEKANVPKGTVSKITAGLTKNPGLKTVKAIVHALGFTMDDLDTFPNIHTKNDITSEQMELLSKYENLDPYGQQAVDSILKIESERCATKADNETIVNIEPVQTIPLKYAYNKASAGDGFLDLGDMDTMITVEYNDMTRKADFCVDVKGDSMSPKFKDGDTLLVRQQPSVDEKEIGVFIVEGKGYVKINGKKELLSLNKKYPNIPKTEDSYCFGKVVGVLKKEWIK